MWATKCAAWERRSPSEPWLDFHLSPTFKGHTKSWSKLKHLAHRCFPQRLVATKNIKNGLILISQQNVNSFPLQLVKKVLPLLTSGVNYLLIGSCNPGHGDLTLGVRNTPKHTCLRWTWPNTDTVILVEIWLISIIIYSSATKGATAHCAQESQWANILSSCCMLHLNLWSLWKSLGGQSGS